MTEVPPCLVLAAGLGTRLRPLTDMLPKAAVPVLGRPLASYALVRLQALGLRRVVLNAHHLADRLETVLDSYVALRFPELSLHYSVETPHLLGTGGGLVKARAHLGTGTFEVWNGDVLTDVDLAPVVEEHRRSGAEVTLVLVEHPAVERFGAVQTDAEGRVVDLAGVATGKGGPAARRGVFTGIQVAEPSLLNALPQEGPSCVVRQGHARLMARGGAVRAVYHPGRWQDLGTPASYLGANLDLLQGDFPLPTAPAPGEDPHQRGLDALFLEAAYAVDGRGRTYGNPDTVEGISRAHLEPPFLFGPGCAVAEGARIGPDAVLGAHVTVGKEAWVSRSLTWSLVDIAPQEVLMGSIAWRQGGEQRRLTAEGPG